jgi:photosystem II stability/assembly factor-like uncharacterized protein
MMSLSSLPAVHSLTSLSRLGFVALLAVPSVGEAQWSHQASGTTASLRGLSVVSARVAWASGTRGTIVHTTDGGATWKVDSIPGGAGFDLRAIHARSARVAHVSATAGRIWRTTDGGQRWSLRYQARDTSVFLDAVDFWDDRHGIALGDPIRGRFVVLLTNDGGESWHEAPSASRPTAEPGEAAFAASGSSLVIGRGDSAFLGTGGSVARVHVTGDRGRTWRAYPTPMLQGAPSRGIFSVAVPATGSLLLVGGDYAQPDTIRGNAVSSRDRRTYELAARSAPPRGYRPAVAIAVGPDGSDLSVNHGGHWLPFGTTGFHAVRASRDGIFFASGSEGRIAMFNARRLR